MMPSNGPPTPQGVGGPTPPLVSRGSEEEGGKRISSEGLPPLGRKGYSASPARVEGEVSPPNRDGGECPRNLKGDEKSPPTHGRKASPVREEEELPAPNRVRGEGPFHSEGGEESPPPTR